MTHNAERMKREMPESEVLAGIINHGEHREKQKHNHEGHEEPKEKKHLTADGRRQTQTTRTSPGSKKMSCLRMRISRLIIIRKQHYSEPDDSGSTAPRLASRCSLSDLIVDIRRRQTRGQKKTISDFELRIADLKIQKYLSSDL